MKQRKMTNAWMFVVVVMLTTEVVWHTSVTIFMALSSEPTVENISVVSLRTYPLARLEILHPFSYLENQDKGPSWSTSGLALEKTEQCNKLEQYIFGHMYICWTNVYSTSHFLLCSTVHLTYICISYSLRWLVFLLNWYHLDINSTRWTDFTFHVYDFCLWFLVFPCFVTPHIHISQHPPLPPILVFLFKDINQLCLYQCFS